MKNISIVMGVLAVSGLLSVGCAATASAPGVNDGTVSAQQKAGELESASGGSKSADDTLPHAEDETAKEATEQAAGGSDDSALGHNGEAEAEQHDQSGQDDNQSGQSGQNGQNGQNSGSRSGGQGTSGSSSQGTSGSNSSPNGPGVNSGSSTVNGQAHVDGFSGTSGESESELELEQARLAGGGNAAAGEVIREQLEAEAAAALAAGITHL